MVDLGGFFVISISLDWGYLGGDGACPLLFYRAFSKKMARLSSTKQQSFLLNQTSFAVEAANVISRDLW